jgi:hypothetical protein
LEEIDRVAVLDSNEPVVQAIQGRTNQHLGGVGQLDYQISNSALGGVFIPEGFVFEADPYPDSASQSPSHHGRIDKVTVPSS